RVETEHRGLLGGVEVKETDVQTVAAFAPGTAYRDSGRGGVRLAHRVGCIGTQLAGPDEVRVRVEDHDAERRLYEQSLEDRAERVRLAGPGLAAQKRMTV